MTSLLSDRESNRLNLITVKFTKYVYRELNRYIRCLTKYNTGMNLPTYWLFRSINSSISLNAITFIGVYTYLHKYTGHIYSLLTMNIHNICTDF